MIDQSFLSSVSGQGFSSVLRRGLPAALIIGVLPLSTVPIMAQQPEPSSATWRATGNEPSWALSRSGDAMLLELDFGQRKLRFTVPTPEKSGTDSLTYSVSVEGMKLTWTVREALCIDTMSGMPRPEQVAVTLEGKRLSGCGGDPARLLQAREWAVTSLADKPLVPKTSITMTFGKDGTVSGLASCNRFSAGYTLSGEGMSISKGLSTMMACEPDILEQEQKFLSMIGRVSRFSISAGGYPIFYTDDNARIVTGDLP